MDCRPLMTNNNKSIRCTHAYHGIAVNHNGTLDPCCQYAPGVDSMYTVDQYEKYVSDVRTSMHNDYDAGVPHHGCSKCYLEESLGLTSLRNDSNSIWPIKENTLPSIDSPLFHVELRFGNLCNLKCMMCNPNASTSIQAERWQHRDKFKDLNIIGITPKGKKINEWWETDEFDRFITKTLKRAKKINITGGEPFMIPKVSSMLDQLIPRQHLVSLSFNTNLTTLPEGIVDKLKQFNSLRINVSLEGAGAMNEYIRYPSVWTGIENNIKILSDAIGYRRINVHHTLQHTSIYSLPGLADFCQASKFPITLTMVQGIPCLRLDSVPDLDKQKFLNWLDQQNFFSPVNYHFLKNAVDQSTFDVNLYKDYRRYVETLDSIRGTDHDAVFNPLSIDE